MIGQPFCFLITIYERSATMKSNDTNVNVATPNGFREALAFLEQKLRDCEDSVSLIDGLLEGTAQFYGADRAYIIEADWELGIGLNTYEWCQPGVEHQKDMLQFMTMEVFPRWKRFLIENKPVIIPNTEELKAEYPDEYDFFMKYGVRSLLCAPYSKRINQGYVGVDNPTRFQNDPTFLFIMCYAIVLELNEIKMQQSVEAAERKASRYNDNEVYINTFGGLEIISEKGTLTDDNIKSDQCYNFLCFMLLNHKRRYPIDRLYDVVRPSDMNMDASPYTVVKNVVYRVRKTLSIISLEDLIVSKNGTFIINPALNINKDFDRMEDACQRLSETTDAEMIRSYCNAISEIYKGPILPRISGQMWLIPISAYYQRLYLRVLKEYILHKIQIDDSLRAQRAVKEGLSIEPNDSDLHFLMAYFLARHGAKGAAPRRIILQQTGSLFSPNNTPQSNRYWKETLWITAR